MCSKIDQYFLKLDGLRNLRTFDDTSLKYSSTLFYGKMAIGFQQFGVRHILTTAHLILLCLSYAMTLLLFFIQAKASNGDFILRFPDDDSLILKLRPLLSQMTDTDELYSELAATLGRLAGGYLTLKINNKILVIVTVTWQLAAFSLLVPCSMFFGSDEFKAILNIMNFPEAFQYPLALSTYATWLPEDEILLWLGLMYLVQPTTFLFVMVVSSKLSSKGSIYVLYSIPILLIVWLILYISGAAGRPDKCVYLSKEEMLYINRTVLSKRPATWHSRVPVGRLLRINLLPIYFFLELSLHSSNKVLTRSVIFVDKGKYIMNQQYYILVILTVPVVIYGTSKLITILMKSEHINNNKARKYCNTIGVWGLALCCLLIGYCRLGHSVKTVDTISKYTKPFYFMGCFASFYDVAPDYVPFIYAASNGPSPVVSHLIEMLYRAFGRQGMLTMSLSFELVLNAVLLYLLNMWFLFTRIERKNLDINMDEPTTTTNL